MQFYLEYYFFYASLVLDTLMIWTQVDQLPNGLTPSWRQDKIPSGVWAEVICSCMKRTQLTLHMLDKTPRRQPG